MEGRAIVPPGAQTKVASIARRALYLSLTPALPHPIAAHAEYALRRENKVFSSPCDIVFHSALSSVCGRRKRGTRPQQKGQRRTRVGRPIAMDVVIDSQPDTRDAYRLGTHGAAAHTIVAAPWTSLMGLVNGDKKMITSWRQAITWICRTGHTRPRH